MDIDEKQFFDEFGNLSLDQIRKLFENLKHIGMSDEDIQKYSAEYSSFFEKLLAQRKEQESLTKKNQTINIGDD
jgi:ribosomal protein L15